MQYPLFYQDGLMQSLNLKNRTYMMNLFSAHNLYWKNIFKVTVRTRDYMNGYQFADTFSGCSAGIRCGLTGSYITPYQSGYIAAADLLPGYQFDPGGFNHSVGSFN
jgi:hypothetical protein